MDLKERLSNAQDNKTTIAGKLQEARAHVAALEQLYLRVEGQESLLNELIKEEEEGKK